MLTARGTITWTGAAGAVALLLPDVGTTTAEVGSASFPVALLAVLQLALLAVAGWTVVVLGLCAVGGPVGRRARSLLPRAVRTACLAGVAGALTVAPAHADLEPTLPASVLDGLVLPDRPVSATAPTSAPPSTTGPSTAPRPPAEAPTAAAPPDRAAAPGGPARQHVVAVGDTLWSIAEHELGRAVSVADVAERTARWHRANLDVVGHDPDVLHPGQRLQAPGSAS